MARLFRVGIFNQICNATSVQHDVKCHKCTDVTGGSTPYIETTVTRPLSKLKADSEGAVTLTGDVMKESTKIAHTFAKSFLAEKQQDNEFLQRAHIHLHVPEVS